VAEESTDLVRKLRARVQHNHVAADKWAVIPDPLCQAAADEIERLREELTDTIAVSNRHG
jgi:hypothetical protein